MIETANNSQEIFRSGSRWLRADFHLHTKVDKEAFQNWDPESGKSFKKEYVNTLKERGIRVGIITNHNKFDYSEFKSLRKQARKEGIFLLPGVELSIKDGQSGIHVCIVFEPPNWLGEDDFINRFLGRAFPHLTKPQRENNNAHSKWNLSELLENLNEEFEHHHRDSFVISAHIDQDKGLFKEFNESRIEELFNNPLFEKFVLGFQKVTSRDTKQIIQNSFNGYSPAFVEGSDCKNFETIGKSRKEDGKPVKCFIKIGDFNFSAVKYALMDSNRNQCAAGEPAPSQAYITNVRFQTAGDAPLAGKEVYLNPNLNCLIGIRGSGKSTLLEAIRFGLGVKLKSEADPDAYKRDLVKRTLRSGGRVIIDLLDKHSRHYHVERIYGDRPAIYRDGSRLPQFSLENLINVLYFGQKELSRIGTEGFSQDLMEKFFGANMGLVREQIEEGEKRVLQLINEMKHIDEVSSKIKETEEEIAGLNYDIAIFKDREVDKKLNRQVTYNHDKTHLSNMVETGEGSFSDLNQVIENYEERIADLEDYESKENTTLFEQVFSTWKGIHEKVEKIKTIISIADEDIKELKTYEREISKNIQQLQDEFAEIKRSVDLEELNADEYINASKRLNILKTKLKELKKRAAEREKIQTDLKDQLSRLRTLWNDEYQILQQSIDDLNKRDLTIQVELDYRGNREAFKEFLEKIVQGSGITEIKIKKIIKSYYDPIEIYFDLKDEDSKLHQILKGGMHPQKFIKYFEKNISAALTYQVPNKYILKYHGKDIRKHSLGQRASAIMVFLLARQENDLIIIDQPEDDIDNQSIYKDVIKELNKLKGKTQFIFATHNPNIPVLGESEQVFTCAFEGGKMNVQAGSIDTAQTQREIINIMEGGRDAFEKRERKYQEWMN
jgi:predicted ATPase